jgi:glycerophosphoryl diester phosphodiesterase
LLLGHRGASKYARENSPAAFDLALQHGCDGFEFDLRYTRDARSVVCHDPLYNRRRIDRRTFLELQLPAGEDVIRRYASRAYLDIELKVAGEVAPVAEALRKADPRGFIVSSFLPNVLTIVNEQHPQLPLALICENFRQLRRWLSLPIGAVMLHRKLVARDLIDELHSAGKRVFVWTVNRERQMKEFAEHGIDGIISDDTRLLAQTLNPPAQSDNDHARILESYRQTMSRKNQFEPGDGPFRFKVELEGKDGSEVAGLRPPFDVPTVFGTKARVPVRGTINGYPFRSSLSNMGEGHVMVVNAELRAGGKCKAGDTEEIVLERDRAERVVEVPADIKKAIASNKTAQTTWDSMSFTHKKEWVRAISEAKKEETRQARRQKMMDALKAGKRVGF